MSTTDPKRPRFEFDSPRSKPERLINATVPIGYQHLRTYLASGTNDERPIGEQVQDRGHSVRRDLEEGLVLAKLFNTATGEMTEIPARAWHGAELWEALETGLLTRPTGCFWILVDLDRASSAHTKLLSFIAANLRDFPPRLRRLIELYYELGLKDRYHSVDEVKQLLLGKRWDADSATDKITRNNIDTLARILQRPQTVVGAERGTRGRKKSTTAAVTPNYLK